MLKKQTVNEDKIQKSKVQAEQSKPQSKDRKMSRGEILKKVFGHLGKYRIFVVFSVLLAAVSVALTLYIPKLIGYAVDEIIGRSGKLCRDIPNSVSDRNMYGYYGACAVADECVQ